MNIEKKLAKAEGADSAAPKLCLCTVIGTKLNGVVQDLDCPPFVIFTTDERSGTPTDEQKAECIRLWAECDGPAVYEFPENGWPDLQKEMEYQARRAGRIVQPTDTDKETNS